MLSVSKLVHPVFNSNASIFRCRNTGLVTCYCIRMLCEKSGEPTSKTTAKSNNNIDVDPGLESKYSVFKDSDSPVILDVYEEKMYLETIADIASVENDNVYSGLNLKRGIHGVFDIEDLVELLRRDKAQDIFVVKIPPTARYVDYIVIVNGRSKKHMISLAEAVKRVFKKKRLSTDVLPRIEGEKSNKWIALDLGNIALHIFSYDARREYDLESLWSVGREFDSLTNKPPEPLISLLKKHEISLNNIGLKGELL